MTKFATVTATDGKRTVYVGAYADTVTAERVWTLVKWIMGIKWEVKE